MQPHTFPLLFTLIEPQKSESRIDKIDFRLLLLNNRIRLKVKEMWRVNVSYENLPWDEAVVDAFVYRIVKPF